MSKNKHKKDPILKVLKKKKIEDFMVQEEKGSQSNLIDITEDHVNLVFELYSQGKTNREIRQAIKDSGDDNKGLSRRQVSEIIKAIEARKAELMPVPKELTEVE
jgi:hypothetical protein